MGFKPTEEQKTIFKYTRDRNENILINALAGSGKCLGLNTKVLMYDGTIKNVQDIQIGEFLMGDDSTPREVLSTNKGYGDLYEIIPQKGDSWVCNDVHIMSVHDEHTKKIIDIPLNEIKQNKYPNGNFRRYRLQRTGVEFSNNNELDIDPYIVGLWLGDGLTEKGSPIFYINSEDVEVVNYLKNQKFENLDLYIKYNNGNKNCHEIKFSAGNKKGLKSSGSNILRNEFKKCLNESGQKYIPKKYLTGSIENRKRILSGIIDTDGSNSNNGYDIITKFECLADDIIFIARSLGLSAYKKEKICTIKKINFSGLYYRISISGDLSDYPILVERKKSRPRKQIKSVLRTGFKPKYIGNGDYYGFELDGNGRFLLGDFTITHNTSTIIKALDYLPQDKKIIFVAFNKHIRDELREKLPEHIHCNTLHSLGFGAIKRAYGDSIKFEEYKLDKTIKSKSKSWGLEKEYPDYNERMNYLKGIKELVNLTRATVTMKKKYVPYLANNWDIKYNSEQDASRVFKILEAMVSDRKSFDYNDMVYMAATDPKIWLHQYDYVFVDEIQDLTRAQQYLLNKLIKKDRISKKQTGRYFLIGDENQKIYSFSGVDKNTYDWFAKIPNIKPLPLTTTFRCSKAVVREAQKIVPTIKWAEGAEEGEVRSGSVVDEATDGDFVLCRKESPLVELFFEFLLKGKKAVVKGTEMGKNVVDMAKGYSDLNSASSHWLSSLRELRQQLMSSGVLDYETNTTYLALQQKVDTFVFMAKLSNSIEDLKKKCDKMFDDKVSDGITLMTVHKSKGLEADRVFIIRPDILPMNTKMEWQRVQETNLKYIAITRAKKELVWDYDWLDEAEKQKRKNK